TSALDVTLQNSADPVTFTTADVVLNEQQTVAITTPGTPVTFSYNGVSATAPIMMDANTTAAALRNSLETIPALLANEQQTISIPNNGTSITSSSNGVNGPALAYSPATTAANIQANLEQIPLLGPTGSNIITVTGPNGGPFVVTFNQRILGNWDVPMIAVSSV